MCMRNMYSAGPVWGGGSTVSPVVTCMVVHSNSKGFQQRVTQQQTVLPKNTKSHMRSKTGSKTGGSKTGDSDDDSENSEEDSDGSEDSDDSSASDEEVARIPITQSKGAAIVRGQMRKVVGSGAASKKKGGGFL